MKKINYVIVKYINDEWAVIYTKKPHTHIQHNTQQQMGESTTDAAAQQHDGCRYYESRFPEVDDIVIVKVWVYICNI